MNQSVIFQLLLLDTKNIVLFILFQLYQNTVLAKPYALEPYYFDTRLPHMGRAHIQ